MSELEKSESQAFEEEQSARGLRVVDRWENESGMHEGLSVPPWSEKVQKLSVFSKSASDVKFLSRR